MQNRSALFVTTVASTLEAFLTPLAEHLRADGWKVDAAANGAVSNDALAGAFDHRFDIPWERNPRSRGNFRPSTRRMRAIVEDGAYDIVHVHTPIASFVTRWALRPLGGVRPAVIYTAHGFHFYRGQPVVPHAVFRGLEGMAARWTDYLVTLNAEDYCAACSFPGISPDRVRLIPGIGVDVARYAQEASSPHERAGIREGLHIPCGSFVVTMVAEFGPVKRHEHLLRALAASQNERTVLLLVGDGPLMGAMRTRAGELGIAERVRFAGYRRDVPLLLAASDAVTLVSEREGLARSLLEGMAAGKPVIGTKTRGIADLVTPETGWLVPKNDSAALAEALDDAAARPDEALRRGEAARARVEREYALPIIIAAYDDLYHEAITRHV